MKVRQPVKGLFLAPSLLSLANLFLGFLSILATFQGNYRQAAYFIIFAALMDGVDGIVARAAGRVSDFGIELDSLADVVSFGVSGALLVYFWGLRAAEKTAPVLAFVFLTAAVLRLARYNIRTRIQSDRRHYQGLTVPSAAVCLAALVIFRPEPLAAPWQAAAAAVLTVALAGCMVSTFKYRNFFRLSLSRRIDPKTYLFLAVTFGGLIFYHQISLLVLCSLNVVSAPAMALWHKVVRPLPRRTPRSRKELPS